MVQKAPLIVWLITLFTLPLQAEVLFEGYARIFYGNKPAGYTVSRQEIDTEKNLFISTSYLKLKRGLETSESLKAVSDRDLNPISYSFMQVAQGKVKSIDAQFKQQKMLLKITENGKTHKIEKKISKNAFLSAFLIYKILKSKEGLQEQSRYIYEAVIEEEGKVHPGQLIVLKPQLVNGFEAFKVRNLIDMETESSADKPISNVAKPEAKYTEFVSYINSQGHLLEMDVTDLDMRVDLVATQKEATADFNFDEGNMKLLFGDVPLGQVNVKAQALLLKEGIKKIPGKKQGVDPGKGMLIKQLKTQKQTE